MTALIFGANGQDGLYLGQLLKQLGVPSVGVHRNGEGPTRGDVSDFATVDGLIRSIRPSQIYHLAATSTTHHSALFANHAAISTGTLNILESVKESGVPTKVFIAGSGVQFQNEGQPISEASPFCASSAYAVARIQSVHAARYFRTLGVPAYVGYLFHHESPERKDHHVAKMIATAARRIADGSAERLRIGHLSVRKEWTFAGDVVRAMATLVAQDEVFEATIGSGQAHSIADWLECCFQLIGRDWREHVDVESDFIPEYRCLVSDPTTIRRLGWSPLVDFEKLAQMMVLGEKHNG